MDRVPRMTRIEDHDKLTQYIERFDDFKIATEDLVTELRNKENVDQSQINNLQGQIDDINKFFEENNLKELVKTVQRDSLWIRDFKTSWKIMGFIYPLILFILGLLLSGKISPAFLFKNLGF